MILHAAGWLNGGLTASFEKLILDAEMLQMMAAYCEPFAVDTDDAGARCHPRCRAGRAFLRHRAHARSATRRAFYTPLAFQLGQLRHLGGTGRDDAYSRANPIWKKMLAEYEQPAIDPAIDDALKDYMAAAKTQIGRKIALIRALCLLYNRSIS